MAFEMKILKEKYIWVFPLSQKKIYIKSYSLNQTHLRVSDINSNQFIYWPGPSVKAQYWKISSACDVAS